MKNSELINFEKGVPQGSPLSPLLFNIYTSSITQVEKKTNISQSIQKAYNQTKKMERWAKKLNLIFSTKKSKVVAISRKRIDFNEVKVKLQKHKLECKKAHKYLGITIDGKMNWKQHILDIEKIQGKKQDY